MDLIPIGEAARRLEVNTSALRYYEQRGLVRPAKRVGGRRMYGVDALRRLAFIQFMQRLGVDLDTAATILDGPPERWHAVARARIAELDELITQAEQAKEFLRHALDCPAEHPVRECDFLLGALDRRIDGVSLEQLAAEHGGHPPSVTRT